MAEFLRVERICKDFVLRQGPFQRTTRVVHAVREVTLDVPEGATFGLVGESGSGKSTLARLILGLDTPTSGTVWLRGRNVHELSGKDPKAWRREAQLIFQDAYGALSPRMRTGRILAEPLRLHGRADKSSLDGQVAQLLRQVGLDPALADRFPYQLSGGQRQRVAIARALAVGPTLLVCDEPVSALDVSVQATILHLLQSLQQRFGLTYILISHDLRVVRYMADEIAVMYMGVIVERGPAAAVSGDALHPYTRMLLASIPAVSRPLRGWGRPLAPDAGQPRAGLDGCAFAPRCPLVTRHCFEHPPPLRQVAEHRWSACHYAEDVPRRLGGGSSPIAG